MMERIVLFGGGEHCRVVIDALRSAGAPEPFGVIDLLDRVGGEVDGVKIIGTEADLQCLIMKGCTHALVTLGAARLGDDRARVFGIAKAAGFGLAVVSHPSATISGSAQLGEGTFVGPGAVVGTGARVGANCIINSGAIVDHDCVLGDHVHIAPGVVMSGRVRVGERSLVGTGSSVIQGVSIGSRTIVGAGSAVVSDIGAGVVAFGVPCREVSRA